MRKFVRRASARTSNPPKTNDKPQLSKEATIEINATQHTAWRPFLGTCASLSISLTAGGELATT